MVVFALDAAGNNAALSLQCTATGDPSPNITWFRGGQPLGNGVVMADGSLLIENITEVVDATRGGSLYHCTANNSFGTIRSRAANVSYACEWEGKEWVLCMGECVILNLCYALSQILMDLMVQMESKWSMFQLVWMLM